MAQVRARHGSYLFQRPGSANWYVRLRSPDKTIVRSLGTSDKLRAESIALSGFALDDGTVVSIAAHKAKLLAARPRVETVWQSRLDPGLHVGPDGGQIAATERELTFYNHNGAFLRTEPNGSLVPMIVGDGPQSAREEFVMWDKAEGVADSRSKAPTKTGDDDLFQTYLDHGGKSKTGIHGHFRNEAEDMWALFKRLVNKPLAKCTRDDGRVLVAHLRSEGLKDATLRKKLGWLTAAVHLATKDGKFTAANPFSGLVAKPKYTPQDRRMSFDDDDVKLFRAKLGTLSDADQLLFRFLEATGARLGEAFHIDGEEVKGGIRAVTIGTKTEQSLRTIPLPAAVLPFMPKKIKGRLFGGTPAAASKRLNRFLRDAGIADVRKVMHSLRHTAKDTLRNRLKPYDDKIAEAIFGRDDSKSSGDTYGSHGFAMTDLKATIDLVSQL